MGAGQSTSLEAHPPAKALHVLRVTPSSPASRTTIEPFFDFVIGFEGDSLDSQSNVDAFQLERIVESHEGRILNLLVWNSKNRDTRVVPITPSRAWSSPHSDVPTPKEPEPEPQPSLLGLSMRICEPEYAVENVWHVLDVLEGSPAESAGLVPYGDWIIGWSGGVLSAEGDFYDLVEAHVDKPLRVYVYSLDFDTLREVVLVPNRQWDGEGLLGCVFGFGLLHRIPPQPSDRQPGEIPPELQDLEPEEQELFVPADVHHHNEADQAQWAHGSHIHDHDGHQHSLNHDNHGHEHEEHGHEHRQETLTTPPLGPWSANAITIPQRAHSFMNGTGLAGNMTPTAHDCPSDASGHSGNDGETSTLDTEDISSETNSQGSLTSVD